MVQKAHKTITTLLVSSLFVACGEEEKAATTSSNTTNTPVVNPNCDLSLSKLEGTEWLLLREMNGEEATKELRSRVKFVSQDGRLVAKYTAGSISDVYDYPCTLETKKVEGQPDTEELTCRNAPDYEKWCSALLASNRKCSEKMFKMLDSTLSDNPEMQAGSAAAIATFEKARQEGKMDGFKAQYAQLTNGNKLQGLMYIRVAQDTCDLRITDNFMAYINETRLEDSNINGINTPFVPNTEGELLWDDCETPQLFDTTMPEFPEKPEEIQLTTYHPLNTEIHYYLLHDPVRYAEKDCEYSFDTYFNYKPLEKGLEPTKVEGKKDGKPATELRWHIAKQFNAPSKGVDVMMLTAHIKCANQPEKTITACNKVVIK